MTSCSDDILLITTPTEIDNNSLGKASNDEVLYLLQTNKNKMLYDLIRKNGEQFKLDLTERDRTFLEIDDDTYSSVNQIVVTLNNNH